MNLFIRELMKTLLCCALVILLSGCAKEKNINDAGPSFRIVVTSDDGTPLANASVSGGLDWDAYRVETDAAGVAELPGSAYGQTASISKDNYLPIIVSRIGPHGYKLKRTGKKLDLIGSVAGTAVRFRQNELITLDYGGTYHRYAYDDRSVTETFSRKLDDSLTAVKGMLLFGDTLWVATHNAGIFVYSIRNPGAPVLLFRLKVSGYLGPFAVKDSLLVLGDPWEPGPLRIIAFNTDGRFREAARLQNFFVRRMTLIGTKVILLGNSDSLPTVVDIADPSSPHVLYNGLEWNYQSGLFYRQQVILVPRDGYGGDPVRLDYKALDLSDPAHPAASFSFTADSWITGLASDTLAYGKYASHSATISIMSGSLTTGFRTIATTSDDSYEGVTGVFAPYFVIGGRLFKLVERN